MLTLPGEPLGASEAAVFETFVVPRYLTLVSDLALQMLVVSEDAQVAHLHCRTGHPDALLADRLARANIYGLDPSPSAVELARAKAAAYPGSRCEYRVWSDARAPLPDSAFSHALTLHPILDAEQRQTLMKEFARLLAPHGQLLFATPLRGSFGEVVDLLREFCVKYDADWGKQLEAGLLNRPTPEVLATELEEAGFAYVDVDVRPHVLDFRSGRDFVEDPFTRLVLIRELRAHLGDDLIDRALDYVRDAIDKYFSDSRLELTFTLACASGRRAQ